MGYLCEIDHFSCYNKNQLMNEDGDIIIEIKSLYEKHILKPVDEFCVDDYNAFEEGIWDLKEKYQIKDSPFLLLPDPAKEADYEMMNASGDGLAEPEKEAKKQYLAKMRSSYAKLK